MAFLIISSSCHKMLELEVSHRSSLVQGCYFTGVAIQSREKDGSCGDYAVEKQNQNELALRLDLG